MLDLETFAPGDPAGAAAVFHRDGLVIIRDALTQEQLALAQAGGRRVAAEQMGAIPFEEANRGYARYSYGVQLHHPEWAQLIAVPTILPVLDEIWGSEDYICGLGGGDYSAPGAEIQHLHADVHDDIADPLQQVTIFDLPSPFIVVNYVMTEFSERTGATRFVPGTHRTRQKPPTLEEEPERMRRSFVCAPAGTRHHPRRALLARRHAQQQRPSAHHARHRLLRALVPAGEDAGCGASVAVPDVAGACAETRPVHRRRRHVRMPSPPNILFVFTDQHRWDWVGYEGRVPVRTPNLDRLAARGATFSSCRVASPMCAPSRACLAAGVRYGRCGVPDNRADADPALPTFMQSLRAAGYRVAMCGKSDLHKRSHLHGRYGWSSFLGRMGFTDTLDHAGHRDSAAVAGRTAPIEPYMAFLHEHGLAAQVLDDWERRRRHDEEEKGIAAWPCPHDRYFQIDDFTGRAALALLDRLPAGQPWFLQVNFSGPHPYFDACQELLDRYDGVAFPEPAEAPPSPHDHQAIRRSYAAKLEGIDDWTGWIWDAVQRRGEAPGHAVRLLGRPWGDARRARALGQGPAVRRAPCACRWRCPGRVSAPAGGATRRSR